MCLAFLFRVSLVNITNLALFPLICSLRMRAKFVMQKARTTCEGCAPYLSVFGACGLCCSY